MRTTPTPAPATRAAQPPQRANPLINRDFALLWSGQAVSALGDATFAITLVLWVTTVLARGQPWAPLAVGGVLAASIAPEFVVAPLGGVLADRLDRRRAMLAMDAARTLLIAALVPAAGLLPLPFASGGDLPLGWQLGAIYVVVFLASACGQLFNPALFALTAGIVAEPDRAHASGLRQVAASFAAILGPALAAALFFGAGITWALLLNAASFAISFAAVLAMRAPAAPDKGDVEERESVGSALRAGLRFYFGNRVLVTLLVTGVLTLLGFGTLNTLGIFFVTENLRAAPGFYGILSSAQGIGLIAGAALAAAFAQRIGVARVLGLSLLIWGAAILIYARMTSLAPALALMALTGFLLAAAQVAETPLLMHVTPPEFLGRVSSVFVPAIASAELIGIGLSGYLASTVLRGFHMTLLGLSFGPVDTIFTVVGVCILAAGVYALARLRGIHLARE